MSLEPAAREREGWDGEGARASAGSYKSSCQAEAPADLYTSLSCPLQRPPLPRLHLQTHFLSSWPSRLHRHSRLHEPSWGSCLCLQKRLGTVLDKGAGAVDGDQLLWLITGPKGNDFIIGFTFSNPASLHSAAAQRGFPIANPDWTPLSSDETLYSSHGLKIKRKLLPGTCRSFQSQEAIPVSHQSAHSVLSTWRTFSAHRLRHLHPVHTPLRSHPSSRRPSLWEVPLLSAPGAPCASHHHTTYPLSAKRTR